MTMTLLIKYDPHCCQLLNLATIVWFGCKFSSRQNQKKFAHYEIQIDDKFRLCNHFCNYAKIFFDDFFPNLFLFQKHHFLFGCDVSAKAVLFLYSIQVLGYSNYVIVKMVYLVDVVQLLTPEQLLNGIVRRVIFSSSKSMLLSSLCVA